MSSSLIRTTTYSRDSRFRKRLSHTARSYCGCNRNRPGDLVHAPQARRGGGVLLSHDLRPTTMAWQPQEEPLRQLAGYLRDSLSGHDRNAQKHATLVSLQLHFVVLPRTFTTPSSFRLMERAGFNHPGTDLDFLTRCSPKQNLLLISTITSPSLLQAETRPRP